MVMYWLWYNVYNIIVLYVFCVLLWLRLPAKGLRMETSHWLNSVQCKLNGNIYVKIVHGPFSKKKKKAQKHKKNHKITLKKQEKENLLWSISIQMFWTGVVWIIVVFISSNSDGTHSLQSTHCWDTDAMLQFSKNKLILISDGHFHFFLNSSFDQIKVWSLRAAQSNYTRCTNAFLNAELQLFLRIHSLTSSRDLNVLS